MKVLIADKLMASLKGRLETLGCSVMIDPSLRGKRLQEVLKGNAVEVLVVRSTKVDQSHIESCPTLALIIRAGAGVNNIDMKIASKYGVFVANCPGRNAIAVAELAMGHLINMDRRIADNVIDLRSKLRYSRPTLAKKESLARISLMMCWLIF